MFDYLLIKKGGNYLYLQYTIDICAIQYRGKQIYAKDVASFVFLSVSCV